MARLTITLDNKRHQALKEAAARRGKTIGELVEESLDFYGIKSTDSAADLVRRAREGAELPAEEALDLAIEETRRQRKGS